MLLYPAGPKWMGVSVTFNQLETGISKHTSQQLSGPLGVICEVCSPQSLRRSPLGLGSNYLQW